MAKVDMPNYFHPEAKDLIEKLLVVDVAKRLGGTRGGGADEVMAHPWFAGIDWDALYKRQLRAPINPGITGEGTAFFMLIIFLIVSPSSFISCRRFTQLPALFRPDGGAQRVQGERALQGLLDDDEEDEHDDDDEKERKRKKNEDRPSEYAQPRPDVQINSYFPLHTYAHASVRPPCVCIEGTI